MENISTGSHEKLQNTRIIPGSELIEFLGRTQNVDRIVKIVTESFQKCCEDENRDGFLRAKLLSRSVMPPCHCKE